MTFSLHQSDFKRTLFLRMNNVLTVPLKDLHRQEYWTGYCVPIKELFSIERLRVWHRPIVSTNPEIKQPGDDLTPAIFRNIHNNARSI